MFPRDLRAFCDFRAASIRARSGAGALAGTSFPIDRHRPQALGLRWPTRNSLDSVSDRDSLLAFLAACSIAPFTCPGWPRRSSSGCRRRSASCAGLTAGPRGPDDAQKAIPTRPSLCAARLGASSVPGRPSDGDEGSAAGLFEGHPGGQGAALRRRRHPRDRARRHHRDGRDLSPCPIAWRRWRVQVSPRPRTWPTGWCGPRHSLPGRPPHHRADRVGGREAGLTSKNCRWTPCRGWSRASTGASTTCWGSRIRSAPGQASGAPPRPRWPSRSPGGAGGSEAAYDTLVSSHGQCEAAPQDEGCAVGQAPGRPGWGLDPPEKRLHIAVSGPRGSRECRISGLNHRSAANLGLRTCRVSRRSAIRSSWASTRSSRRSTRLQIQRGRLPAVQYRASGAHRDDPERLRITLAVAGFTRDQLEVILEENQLVIRGRQIRGQDETLSTSRHRRPPVPAHLPPCRRHGGAGRGPVQRTLSIDLARPEPERIVRKIDIIGPRQGVRRAAGERHEPL